MIKIGVVLSGCGYLDGSEIHESVSTLISIAQQGAQAVCMAPNAPQAQVINHADGQVVKESRNMMAEAARIARGKILSISDVKAEELDALIFPGGYGAAKNLCDFAFKGPDCMVNPDAANLAKKIHEAGKPIGAICISPVIIAKIFEGARFTLTLGNDWGTTQALEKLGHLHQNCSVEEICIDRENKIVTTPAYMYDAKLDEIFSGIEELVREIIGMAKRKK